MSLSLFFISPDKPEIYPIIDKHYEWYHIHNALTFEAFSELVHKYRPYGIYTYGDISNWNYLPNIFSIRKKWVHLETLPRELDVTTNVFSSILKHKYDSDNPLISVITTTFHSKEKIKRPLNSLKSQSYTNWEWVIWDDSKDNLTYGDLLEIKKTDLRIRVYKAPEHSGVIGEMKRLAAGVSYGSFILELDHDDELHPDLLKWIIEASVKYKEADFFYCHTAELYENTLISRSYGDFFAYGYGANVNIWSDIYNRWITQTITAVPNPVTLRHLVGLPNHVRVWRTAFYDKIGKHNPRLSVSDDYDLLVKSYLGGKWCLIQECAYYQYINESGNFTNIRNSLIQHNVFHLHNFYKHLLPEVPVNHKFQPFWIDDGQEFPKIHFTYDPNPHEYSIIMLEPTKEKIINILNISASIHIYIIGNCPDIPIEIRKKVSWWDLGTNDIAQKIRYAKLALVRGETVLMEDEIDKIQTVKLNIVTPCSRPENLQLLKSSIKFDLIDKWYIVYDTSKNRTYKKQFLNDPKIFELECSDVGIAGHAQRNFAIEKINSGLIYQLDDDNIIHPTFWTLVNKMDIHHFYTFDQQNPDYGNNGILKGDSLEIRKIDMGQFVVPKRMVENIKFNSENYAADGEYIVEVNKSNCSSHVYLPVLASYYNFLSNILKM